MSTESKKPNEVRIVETMAGLNVQVDREQGIIRGVKVIGFESKNGRFYTPEALRSAVAKYEGAKVNIDHPPATEPNRPRGVADRIGVLKNAQFREGAGIFADFHFNPKHSLAEQIAWDAEHNPSAIGFSHNAMVQQGKRQNGRQYIEAVVGVRSVDLVADPATTNGVFESEGHEEEETMDLSKLTLEQIKSGRPDLVTALENEQSGASELQKLQSDLKAAQDKIADFEAKAAAAAKAEAINTQLEAAGFDPNNKHDDKRRHVSEAFRKVLESCETEADRKALIDDRISVVGEWKESTKEVKGQKPVTTAAKESTDTTEGVDWLKRITSR